MPNSNIFMPYTIDNDGILYHDYGVYIANNFSWSVLTTKLAGGLFPKIIGIIYHYIGINPFIVCLFNIIFSSLSAPIIYLIGKSALPSANIAKIYAFLSILTFAHIMNTSVMMRDGYITVFMYLSIFLSFKFYKTKNIHFLVFTLISLFLLYKFRPYAAFVIGFAIIAGYIFSKLKINKTHKGIHTNWFSLIFLILSPVIAVVSLFLLFQAFSFMNVLSVENLIEIRDVSYVGGESDMTMDFSSLYSKFFLLPFIVGYICLFTAPFPWEWINPNRIVYVPDMIFLWCFLPSFFTNIKTLFKTKEFYSCVFIFSIIFMFSIYCITLGNSGAIHRLRGPYIPMIYLIAMQRPNKFLSIIINKIQKWRFI